MKNSNFPSVLEAVCDIMLSSDHEPDQDGASRIRRLGEGDHDGDLATCLGEYQSMASPGTIRLFCEPLSTLAFGAWKDLTETGLAHSDDKDALRNTCRIVAGKTYFHEQLHFMWDFAGHCKMFDPKHAHDFNTEEALATAWSWYCCHEYGRHIWGSNQSAAEAVIRFCFDQIDSASYRNWKNHAHGCFFETTFAEHFNLQAFDCPEIDDPRNRISAFLKQVASQGALCNFEILDQRHGKLHSTYEGNPSAFADWDLDAVLHTPNNCYPKPKCDFREIPKYSHSHDEDIQSHLLLCSTSLEAEDVFICHRNDLKSLDFMHKAIMDRSIKWKRLCLRHNTPPTSRIVMLTELSSLESVFIDPLPLQKIVDNHITPSLERDIFSFQEELTEHKFDY